MNASRPCSVVKHFAQGFNLWTYGANNLYHHDFSIGDTQHGIILFCTAPTALCSRVFHRIRHLYKDSQVTLVMSEKQKDDLVISPADSRTRLITWPAMPILDPEYVKSKILPLTGHAMSAVIFCYTLDIVRNTDPVQMIEMSMRYRHLLAISKAFETDRVFFAGPSCKVHHRDDLFPVVDLVTAEGKVRIPDTLMSGEELQALYSKAVQIPADSLVVEIGHFMGGSTVCLAKACSDGNGNTVLSVDNHSIFPHSREIYLENLRTFSCDGNVASYFCDFETFIIDYWPGIDKPCGLVFIDAQKDFSSAYAYCCFWADKIIAGGYFIFEDYSSNVGVLQAVDQFLIQHPEYRIEEEHPPMLVLKKTERISGEYGVT